MTYLSLRQWSGQFSNPGVITKIRRVIRGRIVNGECLVVQEDSTQGLTDEVRRQIQEGFSPSKVRFSLAHPQLGGRLALRGERRKRRL